MNKANNMQLLIDRISIKHIRDATGTNGMAIAGPLLLLSSATPIAFWKHTMSRDWQWFILVTVKIFKEKWKKLLDESNLSTQHYMPSHPHGSCTEPWRHLLLFDSLAKLNILFTHWQEKDKRIYEFKQTAVTVIYCTQDVKQWLDAS